MQVKQAYPATAEPTIQIRRRIGLVQRMQSLGRDERLSIIKTSGFMARVHGIVIRPGFGNAINYFSRLEGDAAAPAKQFHRLPTRKNRRR